VINFLKTCVSVDTLNLMFFNYMENVSESSVITIYYIKLYGIDVFITILRLERLLPLSRI